MAPRAFRAYSRHAAVPELVDGDARPKSVSQHSQRWKVGRAGWAWPCRRRPVRHASHASGLTTAASRRAVLLLLSDGERVLPSHLQRWCCWLTRAVWPAASPAGPTTTGELITTHRRAVDKHRRGRDNPADRPRNRAVRVSGRVAGRGPGGTTTPPVKSSSTADAWNRISSAAPGPSRPPAGSLDAQPRRTATSTAVHRVHTMMMTVTGFEEWRKIHTDTVCPDPAAQMPEPGRGGSAGDAPGMASASALPPSRRPRAGTITSSVNAPAVEWTST